MDPSCSKVSFGFSKISKQNSSFKRITTTEKEKIQYVDCLDSKTIVCKMDEDVVKEETIDLVIPLKRNLDQNNAVVPEKKMNDPAGKDDTTPDTAETKHIKEQSLEEKAVKEILDDAMKSNDVKEESESAMVILKSKKRSEESKESTIDDYENVPIADFGMAIIKGMGWEPGKGTSKSGKVFSSKAPLIRPRGMGLGADKMQLKTAQEAVSNDNEELKICKGAYVKIIAGSQKGQYGQIEGFLNEDSGRIIIKLAMQASPVSFNEFAVQPVKKGEYEKNSHVLNVAKYEEYKTKSERLPKSKQHDIDMKQRGEDRNSADNVSDSENRSYRIDKHGIKRKNRRIAGSSKERSDDSDRRNYKTDRSSEDENDTEKDKHRTERISENRPDSDVKRHRTNRNSEERIDDDYRRHHGHLRLNRSSQDRDNSERNKHRKQRNSEGRLDDSNKRRHRTD